MSADWGRIILDAQSAHAAWTELFTALLDLSSSGLSAVALHDATVVPDRLLAEAAWELWEAFSDHAEKTSSHLKNWACSGVCGRAVLVLDALSLRELSVLVGAAQARNIQPVQIKVTGSECPSTTDQFAKSLGLPSRSALRDNGKPGTFALFGGHCTTDVMSLPFEDCTVPPSPNLVIWHTWPDELIHQPTQSPERIARDTARTLQGDGFWQLINRLRQGRSVVITSDHGYALSQRFSSEVDDPSAIEILKQTFGASRNKPAAVPWQKRFMPPIVMTAHHQHIVMGQRKWKVQGGFPHVCHGGMSLLEVAVPWIELGSL